MNKWVCEYTSGRKMMHNEPRSGHSSDIVKVNSVVAVCAALETDCRLTVDAIAHPPAKNGSSSISQGSIHSILHDHLDLSKFSAQWIPKELTEDYRRISVGAVLHFLTLYNQRRGIQPIPRT